MTELKAYHVEGNGDETNAAVVFARRADHARRRGAGEIGCDDHEVSSCRRAAQYDQYAPGPIPPEVMISQGWVFFCAHCAAEVDNGPFWRHDVLMAPQAVVEDGDVFCCAGCRMEAWAKDRANEQARIALMEWFEAQMPDAVIRQVYVEGETLTCSDELRCFVEFDFPGSRHGTARCAFGDDECIVIPQDMDAFARWRAGRKQDTCKVEA